MRSLKLRCFLGPVRRGCGGGRVGAAGDDKRHHGVLGRAVRAAPRVHRANASSRCRAPSRATRASRFDDVVGKADGIHCRQAGDTAPGVARRARARRNRSRPASPGATRPHRRALSMRVGVLAHLSGRRRARAVGVARARSACTRRGNLRLRSIRNEPRNAAASKDYLRDVVPSAADRDFQRSSPAHRANRSRGSSASARSTSASRRSSRRRDIDVFGPNRGRACRC
jgi:hypothetical protein